MDVVVLLALGGRELERDRAPRHTIVFAIGYLNLAPRHLLVNCSLEQSHTHYSSSKLGAAVSPRSVLVGISSVFSERILRSKLYSEVEPAAVK